MRIALTILAGLLMLSAAAWAAEEEAPRCEYCGMFYEQSPTRVSATIDFQDETYSHIFDCFGCLHDFVHENYGEVQPSALSVLDFATFGTDDEQMLDAFEASYLFGTSRIKGSMPPYVAAFASEQSAKAAQAKLGGELTDYTGLKKLMMNAKGEDNTDGVEGHEHSEDSGAEATVYGCPCTGGCCDDIESSEPGECPRCGMELVEK